MKSPDGMTSNCSESEVFFHSFCISFFIEAGSTIEAVVQGTARTIAILCSLLSSMIGISYRRLNPNDVHSVLL